MKFHSKKQQVLLELSRSLEPVTLKELLEHLGSEYSERTLRRYLFAMIREGIIIKEGETKNARYSVIQKKDRQIDTISSCFKPHSKKVIAKIRRPLFERKPISYRDDWIESYKPNLSFYIPKEVKKELLQAGTRLSFEQPAGTYAHQIFNRLLIDLSYNSSRLEGNTYSRLETEKLLLEGKEVDEKLDEEKIMILNHKEAIRYLVDRSSKLEINYETICTLHYLLSDGLIDPAFAGKIRNEGVRIIGTTYIPYESSEQLKPRLEKILKKASQIKDPYEASFFLLVHLSYLQPFLDVNKRTSRLGCNIPLIQNNLVPLSFNDVEKEDYISSMIAIYELQDIRPLLDLYTFSYMRTCALYDSTVKTLGFDRIRVQYRSERRKLVRTIIQKKLWGNKLDGFIEKETKKNIPQKDRIAFIKDVQEDIKEMDSNYLSGLGITPSEWEEWKKHKN
jgi:fido (protein-threonine AMPylation protein)